jgi:hypothetical protein
MRLPRLEWNSAESTSAVSLKLLSSPTRSHWEKNMEADYFKQLSRISLRIWIHIRNGFSPWIRDQGCIVWWKSRYTVPLIYPLQYFRTVTGIIFIKHNDQKFPSFLTVYVTSYRLVARTVVCKKNTNLCGSDSGLQLKLQELSLCCRKSN